MRAKLFSSLRLCLLLVVGSSAAPVLAQGRIIAMPPDRPRPQPIPQRGVPLVLKQERVNVEITEGVAVATVKQTFRNESGRQIEGTYVFPLPADAAVGDFNMTVNGRELKGEVLDVETARRTYEDIVRRIRDPGLLEYAGGCLYQAKLFPIPPGGVVETELKYAATLSEMDGLGCWHHPLRATGAADVPVEQLVVQVKLRSSSPLTSVFCPTHKCEIVRSGEHEAQISYERTNVRLDTDFQLYYQHSNDALGFSVLTHREPGEPGYFMFRLAPQQSLSEARVQPKDIAFVIDTSGSMRGGKIEQVRKALEFCINGLNKDDHFNIYAFSTGVHPFRDDLTPVTDDTRAAAVKFARDLQALGGTNIHQALLAALAADPADDARPYLVVFMTDGQATVDETNTGRLLESVSQHNKRGVRFHVLGAGTDVDTHLLDKLAELNRGTREYCVEGEDLELKLSALAGRLANPVLTDLVLNVAGLQVFDRYPQTLPDLFHGGELVVLGRYDGNGHHALSLQGQWADQQRVYVHEADFPQVSMGDDFLPRLWAQRKVAYLLDQIRLHGENKELKNEVVRLATRYGIVTSYTSSLIVEEGERLAWVRGGGAPARGAIAGAARERSAAGGRGTARVAKAPASGEIAVDLSRDLNKQQQADAIVGEPVELEGRQIVRYAAGKTFVLDAERWVDTAWDGKQTPEKLVAFSDAYFDLLRREPALAPVFALGERVVVVYEGVTYETAPADEAEEGGDGN
ncbi:MAG: VIT domain-containing protein [Phycisphaerae bacterium]|jgi:Ca-activated chloride channel family protein